jgi:hypothetical protein
VVARALLHLVDRMLEGDEEIDWVAAYSALEVIEQDLRSRGLDGQALGWWTKKERYDFKATANSVEVLGYRARHGKQSGLTEARMTSKEASFFVRRAAWCGSPPIRATGSRALTTIGPAGASVDRKGHPGDLAPGGHKGRRAAPAGTYNLS